MIGGLVIHLLRFPVVLQYCTYGIDHHSPSPSPSNHVAMYVEKHLFFSF